MTETLCVGCGEETVELIDPSAPVEFKILEVCDKCGGPCETQTRDLPCQITA